jgi:hypothetical protein
VFTGAFVYYRKTAVCTGFRSFYLAICPLSRPKRLKRVPMAQETHLVHSSSDLCMTGQCMIIRTGAVGNQTKCNTEVHCSSVCFLLSVFLALQPFWLYFPQPGSGL